ncbi:MAG: HAMP domain-containing sensor histidine kinase [Saprospiraceae bacterium]
MQKQYPYYLMGFSMLLLAAFLFLFLRKSWQDEVDNLRKETGNLFIRSVHDIEGDVLERIVSSRILLTEDVSTKIPPLEPMNIQKDTARVFAYVSSTKVDAKGDTSIRIEVDQIGSPHEQKWLGTSGSLSLVIALTEDSTDSKQPRQLLPVLEERFRKEVEKSGLPVAFKIKESSSQDTLHFVKNASASYLDMPTGTSYYAEVSNYNWYIFRRIWPEIVFSLLLLVSVGGAFYSINRSLASQRRLAAMKSDFIANMTHELQTPIATMSVVLEALRNFDAIKDPVKTGEYLGIAEGELKRLSLLVDKVLHFSTMEGKSLQLNKEPLDLGPLVAQVANAMKMHFENKGGQLHLNIGPDPHILLADKLHLTGVIYNLLDNALKYSGEQPVVELELESEAENLVLKVTDNGPGIPEDYREKVFERFFRVPTGEVHNIKGHGLGLSYVYHVVRLHGGSVSVDCPKEGGCTFRIALPKSPKS